MNSKKPTIIQLIQKNSEAINKYFDSYPHPRNADGSKRVLKFGTSGIRYHHELLPHAMLKAALFLIFRSFNASCDAVGLVITASHNPEEDNGVKLADRFGTPLEKSLENPLMAFVNSEDDVARDLCSLIEKHCDPDHVAQSLQRPALVFLGRDSRPHSDHFFDIIVHLLDVCKDFVSYRDFGYLSTPQLFGVVEFYYDVCSRTKDSVESEVSREKFFGRMILNFKQLMQDSKELFGKSKTKPRDLYVDCSNGVGSLSLELLKTHVADFLRIHCYNKFREGEVNKDCGAEYVHKTKKCAKNFVEKEINASLDGDADRIIYFYKAEDQSEAYVLEGDKILILLVKYVLALKEKARCFFEENDFTIGAIQTAYANGTSTAFLKQLKVETGIAKTGVKNMHSKAGEFDVGAYFESNGHGTLLLSKRFGAKAAERLRAIQREPESESSRELALALKCFLGMKAVANQCYADAVSTVLLNEVILSSFGIGFQEVFDFYKDRPAVNYKLKGLDKGYIKRVSEDETKVLDPPHLQQLIDKIVERYPEGRCFVRASGTEDMIRIYVESTNSELANRLAEEVAELIIAEYAEEIKEK